MAEIFKLRQVTSCEPGLVDGLARLTVAVA